jgi:hypothetical protein
VLDYLVSEHSYGNKESRMGKALEKRFGGIGYGWERDILRLVLTVLFRAGSIEVSHAGQKFDTYTDPRCRTPFTNNTAFKSALFTPVKPVDLRTLRRAVESYEALTGETMDMDKNAIAQALKRFAAEELKQVIPIKAQAKPHRLPVLGIIEDCLEFLAAIESSSADDCVNTLAGGGASLRESHDRICKIAACLDDQGLATIGLARRAVGEMWPELQARGQTELEERVKEVQGVLETESFFESLLAIQKAAKEIATAYRSLYEKVHANRSEQFQLATEKIKGRPEWSAVPESMREPVLNPLASRCCTDLKLPGGSLVCVRCRATLSQMESDLAALGGLFTQVVAQIQKLTTPPEVKIQRVRIAEFFSDAMETEEQVKQAVARLQDHLLKLLDEGVKIVVE